MASIDIILAREVHPSTTIHLYKEGIFLKAYELSAYLFVTHIKSFQTKARYYKKVDRALVSIGFPSRCLSSYRRGCMVEFQETADGVDVVLNVASDEEGFSVWKDQALKQELLRMPAKPAAEEAEGSSSAPSGLTDRTLKSKIVSFDLANKTPMQCVWFLAGLQQELQEKKTLYTQPEPG